MRDFHTENRNSGCCAGKNRRDEDWNPYEGEEEPVGGCFARESGSRAEGGYCGCDSGEMPCLSEEEQIDIRRWREAEPEQSEWPESMTGQSGERAVSQILIPERVGRRPQPNRPQPNRPMKPGWEEPKPGRPMPQPGRPMPQPDRPTKPNMGIRSGENDRLAGFRNEQPSNGYDYEDIIEDEQKTERDLRMLQSMYPEAVREILPHVEEICDRMEYEGSMMFDEYPDKDTVRRLSDEIYEQTGDVWPREPMQEPDGVMSMQYQGNKRRPAGELIQVLLLQEMHHRRRRHRRCRPHMF